ncbi:MAG: hypothetical protein GY953_21645, partial [bacterium]|nr:hypothetical protein [bacterium]
MKIAAVVCALLLTLSAAAEDPTRNALIRAAREITDRAAAEVQSAATWEKHRAQRLDQMRDMLGLLPWPERTPLNVQQTGTLSGDGYTIEKLAFESLPKIYVTANLYVPAGREGRVPAIVYVCGHAYSPHGNKTKYQRHGISLAKNGYVAIIVDSIQIAETFGLHHGVYNQEMYDWYARGYSPAGVEVWNAIRAIDYLETREEVDASRIGITGRSGGAAMSWFTAAVEPRVKAAVPVMGISTYAANLLEDTQKRHCDCMFVVNAYRHDMLHQGALIAPRPLLMMHGRQDKLFPVPGYEEFEQRIGALYRSFDRGDAFGNIVVDTGHSDSDYLREQAIRFFDRHLMGVSDRQLDLDYSNKDEAELAAFAGSPPADAQNYRVHETFIPAPEFRRFPTRAQWEQRRTQLLSELGSRVFGALKVDAPLNQRRKPLDDYFDEVIFQSEAGVDVRGLLHTPRKAESPVPALLWVASPSEDTAALRQMFRNARRPDSVIRMVVYPRGGDWSKSYWKATLRNAMHVGQTVDSLRLRDVVRALELLRSIEGVDQSRITIAGDGTPGVLGLYAAILDPKVHQVLLMRPPTTHADGPVFLNVLRY